MGDSTPDGRPPSMDPMRVRNVVRAAAKRAKAPEVKSWLTMDERGIWEREAAHLLDKTADRAKEMGLSLVAHDDAVADELVLRALTAVVASRTKRG